MFNWLEHVVVDAHGEDLWDELIEAAGVSGAYTSMGGYSDDDLMALVAAAAAALDQPQDEFVRWFGRGTIELLIAGHCDLFDAHRTSRSFLLGLNDVVHPAARRLTPGAETPTFVFDTASPDALVIEYRSRRELCAFAHGLLQGVATYYGETARIRHLECRRSGDPRCTLELSCVT
jgi:hypothetical protein